MLLIYIQHLNMANSILTNLRECRDVNRYIVCYSQVRTTMEIRLKTFSVILGGVYIVYMYVWSI